MDAEKTREDKRHFDDVIASLEAQITRTGAFVGGALAAFSTSYLW